MRVCSHTWRPVQGRRETARSSLFRGSYGVFGQIRQTWLIGSTPIRFSRNRRIRVGPMVRLLGRRWAGQVGLVSKILQDCSKLGSRRALSFLLSWLGLGFSLALHLLLLELILVSGWPSWLIKETRHGTVALFWLLCLEPRIWRVWLPGHQTRILVPGILGQTRVLHVRALHPGVQDGIVFQSWVVCVGTRNRRVV